MSQNKIKVSIVGATGYTGVELLRILAAHPKVEIMHVTSRQEKGRPISDIFPNLRAYYDLVYTDPDAPILEESDLIFFATPHTVAMKQVAKFLDKGIRIIDLSADFRLKDVAIWEKWYQVKHEAKEYIAHAVYGLVEMNREKIKHAQLVAVPGCYVTAITLALLPFLKQQLLHSKEVIIADCKSGVSGAGKNAKIANLFCEAGDNLKAYGLVRHRHLPEIQQNISLFTKKIAKQFIFIPHLIPMIRGMQATIYLKLKEDCGEVNIQKMFEEYYQNDYFIDVLPLGGVPETKNVRGSNFCQLAIHKTFEKDRYIILSVIDNLVKGASGQAVQNMNIMFGFEENLGLTGLSLVP